MDAKGKTAMQLAVDHSNWCNKGQPQVIEMLGAAGARFDICMVARAGVLSLVQKLVAEDPGVLKPFNEEGETPLDVAVNGWSAGDGAVIEYVYPLIPALNIWMAAQFGNIERVSELLAGDRSLVTRARQGGGFRPLDCAARNWRAQDLIVPVIDLLVVNGADVNARPGGTGWTPLQACAEWWNDTQIADALLRHGADINARSEQGWTPLQFALALGREEMAAFLRSRGGTE